MITTEKRITANRRNAQHSTGPTSRKGKSLSRLNAIKHGLLAKQVVARGCFYEESPRDFKTLSREFHESLAPVGPLEEMLVSQIIMVAWRLRRVRAAETGEVATNVDNTWWNPRQTPWQMGNGSTWNPLTTSMIDFKGSVAGIQIVIDALQELRNAVEKAGEITRENLKEFQRYSLQPNEIIGKLQHLRSRFESNPERLTPGECRQRHVQEVIEYLETQIAEFAELQAIRQEQMDKEDSMRRSAAMMPNADILEKIVRYESALQRQLYRSMNQLERLQRRRLGEPVPPPVVMDVSLRG
jgi:hypothetical protein